MSQSNTSNGKGKAGRGKGGAEKQQARAAEHGSELAMVCWVYIGLAAALSCGLNAIANVRHAPEGWQQTAAVVIGIVVPGLVLLLGRAGGLAYKRGMRTQAYVVGGIASVLLLLSVWHCQESIGVLTGSHWLLSTAMAIGIDAGMVAAEVTATLAAAPKKASRPRQKKDKPAKDVAAAA
jgi:hypothetical protein